MHLHLPPALFAGRPQRIEEMLLAAAGQLVADGDIAEGLLVGEEWFESHAAEAQSLGVNFELPVGGGDHEHFGFIISA